MSLTLGSCSRTVIGRQSPTRGPHNRPHNLITLYPYNHITFSRKLTHFVTQITDVVAVTMESATVSHWRKLVFSSLLGFLGRT